MFANDYKAVAQYQFKNNSAVIQVLHVTTCTLLSTSKNMFWTRAFIYIFKAEICI